MQSAIQYMFESLSSTAQLMAYYRNFSDIPFSEDIAEIVDAEKIAREFFGGLIRPSLHIAVGAEVRYKRINYCLKNYTNILEVASGCSPRGLQFTRDPSISFVATDLHDSLKVYKEFTQTISKRYSLRLDNLHTAEVNVLSADQLKRAADLLPPGEIAIVSEGLLAYFSYEEKASFLANARDLLRNRGGALVTSDVMIFPQPQPLSPIRDRVAANTGRDMRQYGFETIDDAKLFFKKAGFNPAVLRPEVVVTSILRLGFEQSPKARISAQHPVWALLPASLD